MSGGEVPGHRGVPNCVRARLPPTFSLQKVVSAAGGELTLLPPARSGQTWVKCERLLWPDPQFREVGVAWVEQDVALLRNEGGGYDQAHRLRRLHPHRAQVASFLGRWK